MLIFIRWLGGLILTLALLVLLAVIVAPRVIDPNDYKDELSDLVKDKTGRDLHLDGELSVSVFPWLGVKTQGLRLSQPEGIDGDMIAVDGAQLRVRFTPLLNKKVEVDTVVLEQPMIRLVTLKNGLDSFAGLSDEGADQAQDDSATAAVALAIQGIELSNGTVKIDNQLEDSQLELRKLNVVTGNLIGSELANISASGEFADASSPDITYFDASAKARIDTDSYDVQISNLTAEVQRADMKFDLFSQSLKVIQTSQVEVLDSTVSLIGDYPGQLTIPKLTANLDTENASIDRLSLNFKNLRAQVSDFRVKQFAEQPSATGRIEIPSFDARELIKQLEIDFQSSDPNVLENVGFSADFAGSLEGALVQNLVLKLDSTTLSGSASIVNFEQPKLKFDLGLTELNLDSYLPDESETQEEVSGGEALVVPMAVFKDINANGSFKADKLISGGVSLTDIDVIVESTPGNVSITPRAKLYEGSLDGAIVFEQSTEKSSLRVKNEIDLVQLSPLLRDAIDSDQLRGLGTLGLDLLVTEINGKQSNQGTIELRASNGALSGIDVYNIIGKMNAAAELYSNFSAEQQPTTQDAQVQGKKTDNTEFSELLGTFHLKDFLMTNDDLKFNGPGFEISGAGQFDLEKESIDYRVNLLIQEGINAIGGAGVQKLLGSKLTWLAGKQIPVHCTGSFESPVCLPDVKALYSFYLSSKVEEKKSELLQEKLGIQVEPGKKVRTKDIFKQLILNEVIKDDSPSDDQGRDSREVPIGERDERDTASQGGQVEEAPSDVSDRPKTRKELREDAARKLLESIFD